MPANRVLGGGDSAVLRVDVPAGAAAAARRALAHGKSVHASLRAVVRDASGNQRVKRAGVQVAG